MPLVRTGDLQISQNAVRFHHGRVRPVAAACAALANESTASVGLHLDHVEDGELLRAAGAAGFSSAMFDAGARPYADNLAATSAAAQWAHANGIWLEAELGYVGGKPGARRARTPPACEPIRPRRPGS